MNLKRTLFTGIAAVGLMASLAAPMASAQTSEDGSNNNASAAVNVVSNGTFDVYFDPGTAINMGTKTLNAANPQDTATGQLVVKYTDTMQQRSAFTVSLSAANFQRLQGGTSIIPASGFRVTHTGNIGQYQWDGHNVNDSDHGNGTVTPVIGNIGDIGFLVDGSDTGNQAGNVNNVWTPGLTQLGTGTRIQFGYPGIGTVAAGGIVDVELAIPNGTEAGTYQTTLTLSVVFTAP